MSLSMLAIIVYVMSVAVVFLALSVFFDYVWFEGQNDETD